MTRLIDEVPPPRVKSGLGSHGDSALSEGARAARSTSVVGRDRSGAVALCACALIASLIWSYWPILCEMVGRWERDPRYSHGFLVPLFSCYLLWSRRSTRPPDVPSTWAALSLLTAAAALRLFGARYFVWWFEAISLLVALAGLCSLLGGLSTLRWASASFAILVFMVPLPYRFEVALAGPLQRLATVASSCVLQVFGVPAFSSGNTIVIEDFRIGVIDACNGIGMSYMFLACSFGAALVIRSSLLDGAILVASAVPIGLAANIARIVATGLLHRTVGRWLADAVYHDLAGWLMMFLALFILWLECKLLPHLFIEETIDSPDSATSAEGTRASTEVMMKSTARPRLTALTFVGVAIVIATGAVTGRWTHRWTTSDELKLAVARLDGVPQTIGDWVGSEEQVNPQDLIAADLQGCVVRRYENRRNGRKIGVMLVCGRPGPVAVHTPDVCYPSNGYKMDQDQPDTIVLKPKSGLIESQFLAARFRREHAVTSEGLRIFWSWSASGNWTVPRSTRLEFAGHPFLYKLYVISTSAGEQDQIGAPWQKEFIERFLVELDKRLFPLPSQRPVQTSVTGVGISGF
jgi:exosortase